LIEASSYEAIVGSYFIRSLHSSPMISFLSLPKNNMLRILFLITLMFQTGILLSQDKMPSLDQSPLDLSYCPANYPMMKTQGKNSETLIARVFYSRPSVLGRKIFGELIAFDKIWRVGANESTEIEFFKDVTVGSAKLKKGRYTLYAIPRENKWTIIFNKDLYTWGAFVYDSKKDIARTDVSPKSLQQPVEALTIYFERSHIGYQMNILWENTGVSVPISTAK
jgi:hypothetical protein